MTIEQYTDYLFKNQASFNLSEIGRRINLDVPFLWNAINKKTDSKGFAVKIPKRCLPLLGDYFEKLQIKISH